MSQSPPPYSDISGLYVQNDKHVDLTLASYNGNARPGQLVVDTADFSLYIGNSSGNLNPAGGVACTGNITFNCSDICNNNDAPLFVTSLHTTPVSINSDVYAQLYWMPNVADTANFDPDGGGPVYSWAYVDSDGFIIENANSITGNNNTWRFNNSGEFTLPDDTVLGSIEGANTVGFYNARANTQFLIELGPTYAWDFNGNDGSLSTTSLNSGEIFHQTGLFVENAGVATPATGALHIPQNGDAANPIELTNTVGNITVNTNSGANTRVWTFNLNGTIQSPVITVDALPAATTAGLKTFVSDANLVATGNFGAVVGNLGSNTVPVYSDGANWRIG